MKRLEPCAGKLARTVLRGLGISNDPRLPDYVNAERVRRKFLMGKPVGVLGNQGACVIAKSYEMKAARVKTGAPIWDAVKLCPEGSHVRRVI
jgi:nucleotidyltransferase/DNA polymerase involved in DNA repair